MGQGQEVGVEMYDNVINSFLEVTLSSCIFHPKLYAKIIVCVNYVCDW